jgi:uncharacterized protein (DUF1778 family)
MDRLRTTPRGAEATKTEVLQVRVTSGVLSLIRIAAESNGSTISAWMRRIVCDAAFAELTAGAEKAVGLK